MVICLVCYFAIDHIYRGLMERDKWGNLGLGNVQPENRTAEDAPEKADKET
jgi:hypothetical protein